MEMIYLIFVLFSQILSAQSLTLTKRDTVQEDFDNIIKSINGETQNLKFDSTTSNTFKSNTVEEKSSEFPDKIFSDTTSLSTNFSTSSTTKSLLSSSSSSTSTTTTTITTTTNFSTTTTETPGCETSYDLTQTCSALPIEIVGVNFWDIYYSIFSDDILRALLFTCASGHWCLEDKYDFWNSIVMEKAEIVSHSVLFQGVCSSEVISCLDSFTSNKTKCSIYERMDFTLKSIKLLCALKNRVATLQCVQHVIAGLHVTVMDILRNQNEKETNIPVLSSDENCNNPESQMTRTYKCIGFKCPADSVGIFQGFEPWEWFLGDVDVISNDCGYRSDSCEDDTHFGEVEAISTTSTVKNALDEDFSQIYAHDDETIPENSEHKKDDDGAKIMPDNLNIIIGLVTLTVVIVSILCFLFAILWKKKIHLRQKPGYSPLMGKE